ncbi:hypothetical protein CYMTET_7885, partial [Cymbomonas tetramitiformis]
SAVEQEPCGTPPRNAFSVLMGASGSSQMRAAAPTAGAVSGAHSPGSGVDSGSAGGGAGHGAARRNWPRFPGADALMQLARDPEGKEQVVAYDSEMLLLQDKYPKGRYHWLVVARDPELESAACLRLEHAPLIERMIAKARELTREHPGLPFRIGFHASPSLQQMHMHIMRSLTQAIVDAIKEFFRTRLEPKYKACLAPEQQSSRRRELDYTGRFRGWKQLRYVLRTFSGKHDQAVSIPLFDPKKGCALKKIFNGGRQFKAKDPFKLSDVGFSFAGELISEEDAKTLQKELTAILEAKGCEPIIELLKECLADIFDQEWAPKPTDHIWVSFEQEVRALLQKDIVGFFFLISKTAKHPENDWRVALLGPLRQVHYQSMNLHVVQPMLADPQAERELTALKDSVLQKADKAVSEVMCGGQCDGSRALEVLVINRLQRLEWRRRLEKMFARLPLEFLKKMKSGQLGRDRLRGSQPQEHGDPRPQLMDLIRLTEYTRRQLQADAPQGDSLASASTNDTFQQPPQASLGADAPQGDSLANASTNDTFQQPPQASLGALGYDAIMTTPEFNAEEGMTPAVTPTSRDPVPAETSGAAPISLGKEGNATFLTDRERDLIVEEAMKAYRGRSGCATRTEFLETTKEKVEEAVTTVAAPSVTTTEVAFSVGTTHVVATLSVMVTAAYAASNWTSPRPQIPVLLA